jgi:hypothetical protein
MGRNRTLHCPDAIRQTNAPVWPASGSGPARRLARSARSPRSGRSPSNGRATQRRLRFESLELVLQVACLVLSIYLLVLALWPLVR